MANSLNPLDWVFDKDPDANLDYSWDWSDWCGAVGDTITSYAIKADSSLTVGSVTRTGEVITAWISGGVVAGFAPVMVTCEITTASGRIDDRSIGLRITER